MNDKLSPIRSLTPSEVTRELLSLYGEAGDVERRMLLMAICGDDRGVTDSSTALAALVEFAAAMPDDERRLQLVLARRWIVVGQRAYGRLDVNAESRSFAVEAVEEDLDSVFYRFAAQIQGRPDGLIDRSLGIMRDSVSALLKRELL